MDTPSTRPYLIRALHEWCVDNGYSPYLAVHVDGSVQVPQEFVKNNEIVLNVSFDATSGLLLGNEFVEFKARFGGVAREIVVPITHVLAIYARENGQGMAFPPPKASAEAASSMREDENLSAAAEGESVRAALRAVPSDVPLDATVAGVDGSPEGPPPTGGRPQLKRIK